MAASKSNRALCVQQGTQVKKRREEDTGEKKCVLDDTSGYTYKSGQECSQMLERDHPCHYTVWHGPCHGVSPARQQFLQITAQHSSGSAHASLQMTLHLARWGFCSANPGCSASQPLHPHEHLKQHLHRQVLPGTPHWGHQPVLLGFVGAALHPDALSSGFWTAFSSA